MRIYFLIMYFVLLLGPSSVVFGQKTTITKDEALEDLEIFQYKLEKYASYLKLRPVNLGYKLDSLRAFLPQEVDLIDFGQELSQIVIEMGDAHANVKLPEFVSNRAHPVPGYLPFVTRQQGSKIVALHYSCRKPLIAEYPYLKSINGIPIKHLLAISGKKYYYQSLPRFYRKSAQQLTYIRHVLQQVNAENGDELKIVLTNFKTDTTITRQINDKRPYFYAFPKSPKTGILDNNIAYIRIDKMYDRSKVEELQPYFNILDAFKEQEVKNSDGMIIDVRNNHGGKRHILMEIFGYFIDKPVVANIAISRLNEFTGLHRRGLYQASNYKWSSEEKLAIEAFKKNTEIDWVVPRNDFLDPVFYMVLSNKRTSFRYTKPVIILMDERNINEVDIFLSAFKQLDQVTLIGMPSSGGSGRSKSFVLPFSQIKITTSTMASYQYNGQLIEGKGVQPDIIAEPTIGDITGKTDSQLDKAVELILQQQ